MPVEPAAPSRAPTLIVVGVALFLLAAGGGYLLMRFLHRPAPPEQAAAEQPIAQAGSADAPAATMPGSAELAIGSSGADAAGTPAPSPLATAGAESAAPAGSIAGSGSHPAAAASALVNPPGPSHIAPLARPPASAATTPGISGAPTRHKPATPASSAITVAGTAGSNPPRAGLASPNTEPPQIGPPRSRPSQNQPAAAPAATAPRLSDVEPSTSVPPAEAPLRAEAAPAEPPAIPQRAPPGNILKPGEQPATASTAGPAGSSAVAPATTLPAAGVMTEEGILYWTGRLKKDQTIVIEGSRASFGNASGDFLPRVAIDVWLPSPAVVLAERPNPKNGWNRVAFRAVRNTDRTVTLNIQWKRLR